MKDNRTVITAETIKKSLISSVKFDIRFFLTIIMPFLTLGIVLSIFFCFDFSVKPNGTVSSVLCGIIAVGLIAFAVGYFLKLLFEYRKIKNGKFRVVQDKLVGIGEDEVRHGGDGLYFADNGRVVLYGGGKRAKCGDLYWLVIYNDRKDTIVSVYETDRYRFVDKQNVEAKEE